MNTIAEAVYEHFREYIRDHCPQLEHNYTHGYGVVWRKPPHVVIPLSMEQDEFTVYSYSEGEQVWREYWRVPTSAPDSLEQIEQHLQKIHNLLP